MATHFTSQTRRSALPWAALQQMHAPGSQLTKTRNILLQPLRRPSWQARFPYHHTSRNVNCATYKGESLHNKTCSEIPMGWTKVVSLCTVSSVICTIDRAAMSVAILPMGDEFAWTDEIKGVVSSAFFGGYTLSNFAGGYLTALIPAATLLGAGVALWSVFTVLTPASAAACSMPLLVSCRAAMGVSEGFAFPSYAALYSKHVPKAKHSFAQTLLYSGQQLGTIIALLTAPKIIEWGSWHAVFYLYGTLGLIWALVWTPIACNLNSSSSNISKSKKVKPIDQFIIPWGEIIRNRAAFSLAITHCSCGYGLFIYQAWLPSFCAHQYNLSLEQAAGLAIGPWLVQAFTTVVAGAVADSIIARRILDRTNTRKTMQTVGSLVPASLLALFAVHPPDNVQDGMFLLTVCFGALGLQGAGFGSNHSDISTKYASGMFGITNAMASISGTLGIYGTGLILQAQLNYAHAPKQVNDGNWTPVFALIAAVYVIGWVFFIAWGSGEEQEFNRL